jgi:hypothetical protein
MCEGDMISGMGAWNVKEQKRNRKGHKAFWYWSHFY